MKRAILPMSVELLTLMLKGIQGQYGTMYDVIENGLPEDTKVIESFVKAGVVYIVVESEHFDESPKNEPLLLLDCPMYKNGEEVIEQRLVWAVGKYITECEHGFAWEMVGVFNNEKKAIDACIKESYFVGPLEIDKPFPDMTVPWKGAYYPSEKGRS